MKKLILLVLFLGCSMSSFSQNLGYTDLSLLFSEDANTGTARFNAMSGAFGALGGDISAVKTNPAGASIFSNSVFSASAASRNTALTARYYGNESSTNEEYVNFSQAGAIFVYKTNANSDWTKFTFGFNYALQNDYNAHFNAVGNSGLATFIEFPLDAGNTPTQYTNSETQSFSNTTNGELAAYNFTIAGVYQNDLHLGASVNTYDLRFSQRSTLREQNNDGDGNILNAKFYQENVTTGTGFSFNFGAIYKATRSLRFGFSYQSSIWFTEILEETNMLNNDGFFGDTEIRVTGDSTIYDNTIGNNFPVQGFSYKLKTPSKTTTSIAYIFGNNGLVSLDYSLHGYKKMMLSNGDFDEENQFFNTSLRNSYSLKIGSEWRFKALSLRGGYQYRQSPDTNAMASDNIKGYSLGAGYRFGNTKFDISYQNKSNTAQYDFYPQYNEVDATELNINNSLVTATLTFNL